MEDKKELKREMNEFLNQVEGIKESINSKSKEIQELEGKLYELNQEEKNFELQYGNTWPEAMQEIQEDKENAESKLKKLNIEKEKEDELKKAEVEKLEGPVADITEILAEIEMFENEVEALKSEKLQYETYSYNWPELAEEKQTEIEKTEKQIDELYSELAKYKGINVNFKGLPVRETKEEQKDAKEYENKEKPKEENREKNKEENRAENQEEPRKENGTENPQLPPIPKEIKEEQPKIIKKGRMQVPPKSKEEKALAKPSRWDKFRKACRNVWNTVKKSWKKVALALGIGASAIAPAAIAHTEQITKQGEKTEERETTKTIEVEVKDDINQVMDNLKIGDILTLEGNTELHYTSNLDNPVATTGNLSKDQQQQLLKFMVTKIRDDKVHFSAIKNEKQMLDHLANGTSNLKTIGELNNLSPEEQAKVGTDIGWISKENLRNQIVPGKHKETKVVKAREEVKVPYEYTSDETTYTYYARPDVDKLERPEDFMKEETHTGNRVRPGQERAKREPGVGDYYSKLDKVKQAREESKNAAEEDIDKLLNKMLENQNMKKNGLNEYRVNNFDNHIEQKAMKNMENYEKENKSLEQEKNEEDKTK